MRQKTIKRGQPFLMVNIRVTYQRQSWIPEAPTDEQVLFIPAASDDNHPVPAIIEEHKLYFNPAYSFPYVYAGPRQPYHLGYTSTRLTKHVQC